jgi:hypothetical protein
MKKLYFIGSWIVFLGLCLLSGFSVNLIFSRSIESLFEGMIVCVVFLGTLYVVICSLNPSHPMVQCPRCQQFSLAPQHLGASQGVYCVVCHYQEINHSTHYLVPLKEFPKKHVSR